MSSRNPFERIPPSSELQHYNVNRPGQEEVIRQSLYDFQAWGASGAGVTQYSFFQVPVGQSSKTKADTNMTNAGMLPNPQKFLVQSLEVFFFPGGEIARILSAATDIDTWSDDIEAFYHGVAYLELTIGTKPYLTEAPMVRFPPKTRIKGNFAVAETAAATNGHYFDMSSAEGRPYFLTPPLLIPPTQNFQVTINFPTALTLPSATDARLGIVMDGLLYRSSQ